MEQHQLIIAVDFDGTIVFDEFPFIGEPVPESVKILKLLKKEGHKLILLTCREGDHLVAACRWLAAQGLEFDAVNENLPGLSWEPRKVLYDALVDDRAVACPMRYMIDGRRCPDWRAVARYISQMKPVEIVG
jgi:hypothetical protein